jgi:hypothetical protein
LRTEIQGQEPLPVTVCELVSPLQRRSQVEPPAHDIEHGPVQATWQVAPMSQVTLPL